MDADMKIDIEHNAIVAIKNSFFIIAYPFELKNNILFQSEPIYRISQMQKRLKVRINRHFDFNVKYNFRIHEKYFLV